MILKYIKCSTFGQPIHYRFASAAAAAIDYYSLLGVERGATTSQIQQAFKKLTKSINPENSPSSFNRLSEAFVILSDGKARDAYDSLMKVRKFSYINEPAHKAPSTQNYVTERKAQRQKQFMKKYNIDKFGKYKGGLPKAGTFKRGTALGQIGALYHPSHSYDVDQFPEYQAVDATKAESFKNFHQDQRQYRNLKRPWFSMKVDYEFFTLKKTLDRLGYARHFILLLLLFPVLIERQYNLWKKFVFYIQNKRRVQKKQKAQAEALKKQQALLAQQQQAQKQAKQKQQASKVEATTNQQSQAVPSVPAAQQK